MQFDINPIQLHRSKFFLLMQCRETAKREYCNILIQCETNTI